MNLKPTESVYPHTYKDTTANGRPFEITEPGLPLIAYFAAHAPEVPDWFQLECPLPYPSDPFHTLNPLQQSAVKEWEASEGETPLPESLKWYPEKAIKYNQDVKSYDRRNAAARYFQWRIYYATTMIAELNKAGV